MPCSASWSAIVLPTVFGAASKPKVPSISISEQGAVHSLPEVSIGGVVASVPVPKIGQTGPLLGLSKFVIGGLVSRFGVQVVLCQSGPLSLRMPKFEPPTIWGYLVKLGCPHAKGFR